MPATYHIRIKKDYASAVIEDRHKMDALEIVPEDEAFAVPKWQQDEVRRRLEKYKSNTELYMDEETFFSLINE